MVVIKYKRESDIGLFHVEGSYGYSDAGVIMSRFLQAFNENNIKAILVFDNARSDLSADEMLVIEKLLSKMDFPRHKKIAIINSDFRYDSIKRFGNVVVSIKGWKIKAFDNESEAREWLKD